MWGWTSGRVAAWSWSWSWSRRSGRRGSMGASERGPALAPAEPWWNQSFMVTFAFKCNLACTFCMVEDALEVFAGTSVESFRRFAEDPRALGGATRIIFSGGEVTLAKDLLEYVAIARSLPSIEHVRIQ